MNPAAKGSLPKYDYSEWPLFVVMMPSTPFSAEAFDVHLEALRAPYLRGQPFAMMIVMGEHPPLPAAQRKAAAEAMRANDERYPNLLRAKAIVVRSTLEQGVVTAVRWMARPEYPFAAFESAPTARDWLIEQLGASHARRSPAV